MAYAQINYSQSMGKNSKYTIAQVGCFLTAFCNLLARYGEGISPSMLNDYFVAHNVYLAAPEEGSNVYDDLSWSSITKYDSGITVVNIGTSMPPNQNAIVKFVYTSPNTGNLTTHFCLVDHIDGVNVYIIDSYDGNVKNASVYGGVKAWATYTEKTNNPQGGSEVVLTADDVTTLYQDLLGRAPDSGGLTNYTGKTLAFTLGDMLSSAEYKAKASSPYTSEITQLQGTVTTLNTEVAQLQQAQIQPAATTEQLNGAKLVEALKEALQS